jgi:hypothetical protein
MGILLRHPHNPTFNTVIAGRRSKSNNNRFLPSSYPVDKKGKSSTISRPYNLRADKKIAGYEAALPFCRTVFIVIYDLFERALSAKPPKERLFQY